MVQMLDPITVVAQNLGYPPYYMGFEPDSSSSDYALQDAQFKHAMSMAQSYCESPQYTSDCAQDLNAMLPDTNRIIEALAEYSSIDRYWERRQLQSDPITMFEAVQIYGVDPQGEFLDTQFGGTPLTPFAALFHYVRGSGTPRQIAIGDLHLMHFAAADIPPIQNKTDNPAIPNGTTLHIDEQYNRNTEYDSLVSWVTVGHITLRVIGDLTINIDGSYHFQGELRAFEDTYNGGGDIAERGPVGNWLTGILDALEKVGGRPYTLGITGSIPVNFTGQRP